MVSHLVAPLRGFIRMLQSDAAQVSRSRQRILWATALLPFALVTLFHRSWAKWFKPPCYTVATVFCARMNCRPPDLLQSYVYLFGLWEPDLTAFSRRRLQPGDVYIDIGANVGYYSLLACSLVGEAGRVVAIEASPSIAERLAENVDLNGYNGRARIINMAVSDVAGTLELFGGPDLNLGATSTESHRGMRRVGSIEAAPPAELLTDDEIERARMIKIDVEGGEDRVLAGLVPLIPRFRDDVEIIVEITPKWWRNRELTLETLFGPFYCAGFFPYTMANVYRPWRYLWPQSVRPPVRLQRPLTGGIQRMDIVLSRVDSNEL